MIKYLILLLLFPLCMTGQIRYASATGSGSQNGLSEANAWTYQQAFSNATAGMVVNMKVGTASVGGSINNSGTSAQNPITFRGYRTTPGDITVTQKGTSDSEGQTYTINGTLYPLIEGNDTTGSFGLFVNGDYIVVESMAFKDHNISIIDNGDFNEFNNIYVTSSNRGIHLRSPGDGGVLKNSYVENCAAEQINVQRGQKYVIQYTTTLSDDTADQFPNDGNPLTGYNFAVTIGAQDNIIENCQVYRIPQTSGAQGLYHQGHGFIAKHNCKNNIFRNSVAYNSGIEIAFTDTQFNTWENIELYGNYSSFPGQYSVGIVFANGPQNNLIKNVYVENSLAPIRFEDWDDGYTPSPDTDGGGGTNNTIVNLVSNKSNLIIRYNTKLDEGNVNAFGNECINCTFYDQDGGTLFQGDMNATFLFRNAIFDNLAATSISSPTAGAVFTFTWDNVNFSNESLSNPSGTDITTFAPDFVGPLTSAAGFALNNSSSLIDIGVTDTEAQTDFNGNMRPAGSGYDLGAFENGAGGVGDVTPPSELSSVVSNITNNGAIITGQFSEGTQAQIEWGNDTNYGNTTLLETDYLTAHQQPITGAPSGTQIFYRWTSLQDEAGNTSVGTGGSFTTLGTPPDPPATTAIGGRRILKKKIR